MNYFLSFFLVLTFYVEASWSKRPPCRKEEIPVSTIIERIKKINEKAPYDGFKGDLAIMYLIGSVYENYEICGP